MPTTIEILMWDKLCMNDANKAAEIRAKFPEYTANLDKWARKWKGE